MTHFRFFQFSLFWPFVAWCLYLFFSSFSGDRGAMYILSHVYGSYPIFIPYAIFAVFLWKMVRNRPYGQLILIAFAAPILWGIFYMLFHVVHFYMKEHLVAKWHVLVFMVFWAAVVGYIVEAIPLLILVIFRDDFKST